MDELFGFGPLSPALRDSSVEEILLLGAKSISVRKTGQVEKTDLVFDSEGHLHRMIDRIIWQQPPRQVHLVVRKANETH
jgi:pilus assembly protein CpaF